MSFFLKHIKEGDSLIWGDACEIDLAHLCRQFRVVLQGNLLFVGQGAIRENITMAKPEAILKEIVATAEVVSHRTSASHS
jgi:ABC-type bacteriocin/lantibiotic exporter with double-glycine peptidase domain